MKTHKPKTSIKKEAGKLSADKASSKPARKPRASLPKIVAPRTKPKQPPVGSKHDAILGLLQTQKGAAIAGLVKATGWQPHSVRGFLAGVVRKKLGLNLVSEKVDGVRRYRVEK